MAYSETDGFRNVCRFVLFVFFFQCLLPADLAFYAGPWRISLGPKAAHADTPAQPFFPPLPADPGSPEYLKATPDADSQDPYIVQKAAELGRDPARIFAFVRDQIGYEAYKGSLRGARGTLWSKAGNSLDKASLMIALLRASGIPARYATGILGDAEARTLIGSMFASPLRIVGCVEPGTATADPVADPALLAEAREHYWVEMASGGAFQPADPTVPAAVSGQSFAAAQALFAEVPDGLRHKVTLRLKREIANLFGGLFGGSVLDTATVLEHTFNTAALAGKPLSVGHFVNRSTLGFVLSATTTTFSPFIAEGDLARGPDQDHLIRGGDYQEVLTNFPLGSQALTGVFLEAELAGPDGPAEIHQRTLLDRIGYAVRHNGGSPNVSADPNGLPALTEFDVFTVNILPGQFESTATDTLVQTVAGLQDSLAGLQDTAALTQDQTTRLRQLALARTRIAGSAVFHYSDLLTAPLSEGGVVRAYFDRPRVVITSSRLLPPPAGDATAGIGNAIDLRRDSIRVLPYPGQSSAIARAFRIARGIAETAAETQVASFQATGLPGEAPVVSTQRVFAAAKAAGIGLLAIGAENQSLLESMPLSVEAKGRIMDAIGQGKAAILPERPVDLGAGATVAWYEIDRLTGETIGVTEDGGHQAMVEYSAVHLFNAAANAGLLLGVVSFLVHLHKCLNDAFHPGKTAQECKKDMFDSLQQSALIGAGVGVLLPFPTIVNWLGTIASLGATTGEAAVLLGVGLVIDPPLVNGFLSPPSSDLFAGLAGGGAVLAGIASDPLFTLPANGAQLPLAFRVGIKNTQAAPATYALGLDGPAPAGFTVKTSVPEITVPPGATAEVGVCLQPSGAPPAPGQSASFGISVADKANPANSTRATANLAVPDIHGIRLAADPAAPGAIPGTPVSVNLRAQSVGNVTEAVGFAVDLPAGLSTSSLDGATLPKGGTAARTLVLTPAAGVPLNTTLTATVTASFGPAGSLQTQTLAIPVTVAAPGAKALADASAAAGQLGQPDLAARLGDLGRATNALVSNPTDTVAKSKAEAAIDSLVGLLAADPVLSGFTGDFAAARKVLGSAAAPTEILAALDGLGTALGGFGTTAANLAKHGVTAFLLPNTREAQPGIAVNFELRLTNTGTESTTYDLSPGSLPADTIATFSQPSVTLAPNQSSTGLSVSLTRNSATELLPAAFRVSVVPRGFPNLARGVDGSLTARNEFVSVAAVTASPPFADPGAAVNVSARLLNAVNRARAARVGYVVKDGLGKVIHTSAQTAASLGLRTTLEEVALEPLNSTGLAKGTYTLEATVREADGTAIPGATGTGNLLIGSPVAAHLASAPDTLPAGDGRVANTLTVESRPSLPPLVVAGQLPIAGGTRTVALKGTTAYLCGRATGLIVADVGDPAHPSQVETAASGTYTACRVYGDLLVAAKGDFNTPYRTEVWSLKNDPRHPALLGASADIPASLLTDLLVTKDYLFTSQLQECHYVPGNSIYRQGGDVQAIALNLNDPVDPSGASPAFAKWLYGSSNDPQVRFCPLVGGDHHAWRLAQPDPDTLLVATTTVSGTNTANGTGLIQVLDISDPANFSLKGSLPIPGTVQSLGIAVDGNRALVVGSEGGWTNPMGDGLLQGKLVFTLLDVSDPRHPAILKTHKTALAARTFWSSMTRWSDGRFAFAYEGEQGKPPRLFIIDIKDPERPVIGVTEIPNQLLGLNSMEKAGSLLYTASDAGLLIYSQPEPPALPITATVRVPRDAGAAAVPGSFDTAPNSTAAGAGFDTLVWNFQLPAGGSRAFHWNTAISGLRPGEARKTALGGTVDFTYEGTSGQVPLSPSGVAGESILGLSPATRTVQPGQTARYTLTLRNPTATPVTYALDVPGLDPAWVALDSSATVAAHGETTLDLAVNIPPYAPASTQGVTVVATSSGVQGAAVAELAVQGTAMAPAGLGIAHGVLIELAPATASAGQGTGARYAVRLTNTGSAAESFDLTATLPAGVTARFDQARVEVPPGAFNYREVGLSLSAAQGLLPTAYPFSVQAAFQPAGTIGSTAQGTLNVVAAGVAVEFDRTTGAPGEALSLRVTNIGTVEDSFSLALGGPGALAATLSANTLRLAPGASGLLSVALANLDWSLPGSLGLFALATSGYDGAVQSLASTAIAAPARRGLAADFEPASQHLEAPGKTRFVLRVRNTGNAEDAYRAIITARQGPLDASLQGLDGSPTQAIPEFRLPALADGQLGLDVNLQDYGAGSVTVQVVSASDPGLQATATASVFAGADRLRVVGLTPTASGFRIRFSQNFEPQAINLYPGASSAAAEPADIVLQGSAGPIRGSVVPDSDLTGFSFVRTGGLLASGDYTVALRSGPDAFHNAGGALDGNGDGQAGDAYTAGFAVGPLPAISLSIPDLMRGPGQKAGLKVKAAGASRKFLPVVFQGGKARTIRFSLRYDPAKLAITLIKRGPGLPAGSKLTAQRSQPGRIDFTLSARKPLKPKPRVLARLLASVPATAPYGSPQVLDIDGLAIENGAVAAADDDGVHLVGYLGDASGDRRYGGDDVELARLVAGTDTGLPAYPWVDPVIVADVKPNGRVDPKDLKLLARAAKGKRVAAIPRIPKQLR